MDQESAQKVMVHFVARPDAEIELERRLRGMGFETAKRLAGTSRVVVRATPAELQDRLNIVLEWKSRPRTLVFQRVETAYPEISGSSKLPEAISELVKSFYTPPPPNLYTDAV